MEEEVELKCPFCAEVISILVDPFISEQDFIEDCTVCCRPIQINLMCEDGAVSSIEVVQS
jgi:hypothetical protein